MHNICLDSNFSTTRRLIQKDPSTPIENNSDLLNRKMGGLRTKNYYKESYYKRPLITVITVTRNAKDFLEKSILSVLNQAYDNIEYIIIDGNSNDGTLDVIRQYETYIDYWVSEDDSGIYEAMNKGIKVAAGDWIYFLGADDMLLDVVYKLVPLFKKKRYIYYGNCFWPRQNIVYDGKFNVFKLMNNNICHQSIFYPKDIFDIYQFNMRYKQLADYEFNMRCWSGRKFRFVYLPYLIAVFNDLGGVSATEADFFYNDKEKLLRDFFFLEFIGRKLSRILKKLLEKFGIRIPLV